jgi:hypothetical protein
MAGRSAERDKLARAAERRVIMAADQRQMKPSAASEVFAPLKARLHGGIAAAMVDAV